MFPTAASGSLVTWIWIWDGSQWYASSSILCEMRVPAKKKWKSGLLAEIYAKRDGTLPARYRENGECRRWLICCLGVWNRKRRNTTYQRDKGVWLVANIKNDGNTYHCKRRPKEPRLHVWGFWIYVLSNRLKMSRETFTHQNPFPGTSWR